MSQLMWSVEADWTHNGHCRHFCRCGLGKVRRHFRATRKSDNIHPPRVSSIFFQNIMKYSRKKWASRR
jgi:hypothetical protein